MMYDLYIIMHLIVVQFKMIFPYWFIGVTVGSFISVFASSKINAVLSGMNKQRFSLIVIVCAAMLGVVSPICMYGTVPLIASIGRKGVPQYLLASFMVSSILINPNLFLFSLALGTPLALIRLFVCIIAGVLAGILVKLVFRNNMLFDFSGFQVKKRITNQSSILKIFLSDLKRGIIKTFPYFLIGIILTALFDRYIKGEWMQVAFSSNSRFGVVLAASLGVPIYVCGGGTIPLLKASLNAGMSIGAAVAFMISGPATKLTNLGAIKTILGIRNFAFYMLYTIAFAIISGLVVDMLTLFLPLK
jgi:uncharacterized protein